MPRHLVRSRLSIQLFKLLDRKRLINDLGLLSRSLRCIHPIIWLSRRISFKYYSVFARLLHVREQLLTTIFLSGSLSGFLLRLILILTFLVTCMNKPIVWESRSVVHHEKWISWLFPLIVFYDLNVPEILIFESEMLLWRYTHLAVLLFY
jgi:hypothetical protein